MDRRQVALQLRIVRETVRAAQPVERELMVPRAIEILEKVAVDIESRPDPELIRLLAEVRGEVESGRR